MILACGPKQTLLGLMLVIYYWNYAKVLSNTYETEHEPELFFLAKGIVAHNFLESSMATRRCTYGAVIKT